MPHQWYAARTQPRSEATSAAQLERDGITVFAPFITVSSTKAVHQKIPLFPGYLFARLDLEESGWPSILPAHRLLGWVKFGGEPAWLPNQVISDLREKVASINDGGGLWKQFRPGQKVRIIGNNMDSLAEVLEGAKTANGRTRVLLNFMGRLIQATVPYESLHSVETDKCEGQTPSRRTRGRGRWVKGFKPTPAVT